MREVMFCNALEGLQAAFQGINDKVITYLVFTCDTHSGEIVKFAGAHPQRFRAAEALKRLFPAAPPAALFRVVGRAIAGRRPCRMALQVAQG